MRRGFIILCCLVLWLVSCGLNKNKGVLTGLDRVAEYEHWFKGKKLGIIANHTAFNRKGQFILNVFQQMPGVKIRALFGPEHGFRGNYSAGKKIEGHTFLDSIPIYSLYGENVKPTARMLQDIDVLIFDIQDIGARFYTYIWTMALAMEAAAEQGIPFVVLDRPNPINGLDMEGPLLDTTFASFVGLFPIPVRHGMTVGELATLFNEQGWLKGGIKADLHVIPMKHWRRSMWFDQTGLKFIAPSPNMPNLQTAIVYPGLCLLEGTNVSEGRGTPAPFLRFGAPWIEKEKLLQTLQRFHLPGLQFKPIDFRPVSMPGKAMHPKYENMPCSGIQIVLTERQDVQPFKTGVLIIKTLHDLFPNQFQWRVRHFDRLCGTDRLRKAIDQGEDLQPLLDQWQKDVEAFARLRKPYLLY